MLSAHFPNTYGDRVAHQHTGIVTMRVGHDGKMRPQGPRREDQSDDDLVASADAGSVEPARMKIGLVVPERMSSVELDAAAYGGVQEIEDVEFIVEDDEGSAPGASSPTTPPGQS